MRALKRSGYYRLLLLLLLRARRWLNISKQYYPRAMIMYVGMQLFKLIMWCKLADQTAAVDHMADEGPLSCVCRKPKEQVLFWPVTDKNRHTHVLLQICHSCLKRARMSIVCKKQCFARRSQVSDKQDAVTSIVLRRFGTVSTKRQVYIAKRFPTWNNVFILFTSILRGCKGWHNTPAAMVIISD